MVNNANCLTKVARLMKKKSNVAKNGMALNTKRKGDIEGMLMFKNRDSKFVLKDVLFAKDLRYNLLSIGEMQEAGLENTFKNQTASVSYN